MRFFMRCVLVSVFLLGSSCLSALVIPRQVLIIRNGEKSSTSGNGLGPQGLARAAAFVPFLDATLNPSVLPFGQVTKFVAEKAGTKSNSSTRPIQTVAPLAQARGLKVSSPFTTDQVTDLANLIFTTSQYSGQVILICWSYGMIDSLAHALGAKSAPPYPPDRFDLIYTLNYDQLSGAVTFCVRLQELMFDDSTTLPAGFPGCP